MTRSPLALLVLAALMVEAPLRAQITAQLPTAPMTPAWDKGIQPISRDSYWNAVECGKQGGQRPACVFYDADLCKNDDFTLALYTPYKSVAYEVWRVIRKGQPAPTPPVSEGQRTPGTLGGTAAPPPKKASARGGFQNPRKKDEPTA